MTTRTVTWKRHIFRTVEAEDMEVVCDRVTLRELGTGVEHVSSVASDFQGFLNFMDTTAGVYVTVVCINGQLFSSRTCFGPKEMMLTFVQDPAGSPPTFGKDDLPADDEDVMHYFCGEFPGDDSNDLRQSAYILFPAARLTEDLVKVNDAGVPTLDITFGPLRFRVKFDNLPLQAALATGTRERTRLANMALRAMDICDETDDDEAYFG